MRDKFEEWAGPEYGEYNHGFERRDMFKSYLQGLLDGRTESKLMDRHTIETYVEKAVLDERGRIVEMINARMNIRKITDKEFLKSLGYFDD